MRLNKTFNDTKHRAASLRQLSFLLFFVFVAKANWSPT